MVDRTTRITACGTTTIRVRGAPSNSTSLRTVIPSHGWTITPGGSSVAARQREIGDVLDEGERKGSVRAGSHRRRAPVHTANQPLHQPVDRLRGPTPADRGRDQTPEFGLDPLEGDLPGGLGSAVRAERLP